MSVFNEQQIMLNSALRKDTGQAKVGGGGMLGGDQEKIGYC